MLSCASLSHQGPGRSHRAAVGRHALCAETHSEVVSGCGINLGKRAGRDWAGSPLVCTGGSIRPQ